MELVLPLVEEWHKQYTWEELGRLCDVPARLFWRMREQSEVIEFDTLDKLLVGMGRLDLWRTTFREYYLVDVA